MLNKLLYLWDFFIVALLYLLLRTRWLYFHLHPNYIKFFISDSESHFQHKINGRLHSNIRIELKNGWIL